MASLAAEFIANDRPIIASYKGEILLPVFNEYPESKFGGFLARTDFRDPFIQEEVNNNGWMVWPPIRYSYQTVNRELPSPAPSTASLPAQQGRCLQAVRKGRGRRQLRVWQHELAGHRRPGPRRDRAADLRLPHLGAVRPDR
jgi:microcin C transport system permease protein